MRVLLILAVFLSGADPSEIARINKLKNQAEEAYAQEQYAIAAETYRTLYDTLGVDDPSIGLNLAHSYYALGDSANARLKYQSVASTSSGKLKSIAYQQLGVMAKNPSTLSESLQYLKAALKADPMNEEARYNYEVVKKLLEEQQKQNQDQQNQDKNEDQEKQNEQNEDKKDQDKKNQDEQSGDEKSEEKEDQEKQDSEQKEGEESEEKKEQEQEGEQKEDESEQPNQEPSTREKLEEMNISEEKAKMILEALKNNEIQYIQQQKRKATQPRDSGKPDW